MRYPFRWNAAAEWAQWPGFAVNTANDRFQWRIRPMGIGHLPPATVLLGMDSPADQSGQLVWSSGLENSDSADSAPLKGPAVDSNLGCGKARHALQTDGTAWSASIRLGADLKLGDTAEGRV